MLHGQRFIDPGAYVAALSDAVIERGGKMLIGGVVTGVRDTGRGVVVETETGAAEEYDQLVIATGAWLGPARPPVRREEGRPGGSWLLVLRGGRGSAERSDVLPRCTRRLHACR